MGYKRAFAIGSAVPMKKAVAAKATLAIWDEHCRRLSNSGDDGEYAPTKNENAKNFLRREIYLLGRELRRVPPTNWDVSDLAKSIRPTSIGQDKPLAQTFHALLMSVYSDDMQISRQERWLMARELEYAYRHNVPPELLAGFLLQSGLRTDIPSKVKSGYIEPAFGPPVGGQAA